jgi:hypothetical protein
MLTIHDNQAQGRNSALSGGRAARPAMSAPVPKRDSRLAIQHSLGNDYLQRTAECDESRRESGEEGGCRGGCGGCGLSRLVQTKLNVGRAGDAYEQEADRIAARVVGRAVAQDGGAEVGEGPPIDIRRLPANGGDRAGAALEVALPAGGGRPLTATTRAFMEPRFGQNFSGVRLHTDADAHRLATQIRARAFTHQDDIYLRRGESEHDHRLVAHELTHVIQQRGGATATDPALAALQPPLRDVPPAIRPPRASAATTTVQRAISPELERLEDYLSYGFFDWAITDAEAERALALLETLPRFQQAVFFADTKYASRLRENLPDGRLPELDALAANVAALQPPVATLEDIESRLSYGLFDWAVTDKDAVEALDMLKQLSGRQLATALASINYSRLMDNLPDARKPELADLYDRGLGLGGTRQTEEEEYPGTVIRSITFRSDHGVLKNNTEDWTNSGALYAEPEWFTANGEVVSHPISQSRNTDVLIDVGLNVLPVNAPSGPVRLTGRSTEPALNFDVAGSMQGGLDRTLSLSSTAKLPDTITAIENKQVTWEMTWRDWKHDVGRTRHTVFVTSAAPLDPGQVTGKRMGKAVELTGKAARLIGSVDPHSLVREVMKLWGNYNLDIQLGNNPGDEWRLADNLEVGAQCIDIVRFVNSLLRTVGVPGTSTAVVVWASPYDPNTPVRSVWPHGGLGSFPHHPAHPDWQAALMDANGCPNNFEAALEFDHGGVLRYYPGGVPMNLDYNTPLDVLHVFQCLVWVTYLGTKRWEIQQIALTYPSGTCHTGEVQCH